MGYNELKKIREYLLLFLVLGIIISKAIIEISFVLVILYCLIYPWYQSKTNPLIQIRNVWVWVCFLGYLFITVLYADPFFSGLAYWCNYLEYFFLVLMLSQFEINDGVIKKIIYLVILITFVLGLDAGYQYFSGEDLLRGRIVNQWQNIKRVSAVYAHPNSFGGILAMMIPFTLSLLYININRSVLKKIIFCSVVIQLICLLATFSRGAWIGALVGVYMIMILLDWKWFGLGVILIIISPFILPEILLNRMEDVVNLNNITTQTRIESWQKAWELFLGNPFFGIGLGDFSRLTEQGYVHNSYLEFMTETGIIGLALCLILVLASLIFPFRNLSYDKNQKVLYYGILGACLAFLTHSFIDTNFHTMPLMALFWLFIGLIASIKNEFNRKQLDFVSGDPASNN